MNISIFPEKCIACGLCQTYSNLFDYNDEGIVVFSQTDELTCNTSNDNANALEAVKNCPTKALTIL